MRLHPARARSAVWLTIGALAIAPLAACASPGGSLPAAPAGAISIPPGACGGSWHLAAPGLHTFQIYNASGAAAEVELVNPANGAVYDDIENLREGNTKPMAVKVGSCSGTV